MKNLHHVPKSFFLQILLPFTMLPAWLLLFSSCQRNQSVDEHPEFVNLVYKKTDTVQAMYVDKAFLFIDSAFNALPNPGMGDIFVKDSLKQAKYRFVKQDYIKAIALLDAMMVLIKGKISDEKYAERYASILYEKGECFLKMKRYTESLRFISLAEDAVLNLVKNKCSMSQYTAKKAYLMFAQEKYLLSAEYFKIDNEQSLTPCNMGSYHQLINLQRGINNVALSYLKAGMLDSAAVYENKALTLIETNEASYPQYATEIRNSKGVIYGDQAEVLALQSKNQEAEILYKKSINATSPIDIGYTQLTQARLAEVYLKDNNNEAAYNILNQLKISLDASPNETQLIKWNKLVVKYYTSTNNIPAALAYQQQYELIRDSTEARNKKFISVDIGKEFENLELKYSNEVLQKEGKLKTLYLIIAISTFIAVSAIAFFVWYNLNRTRKLHRQVARKNDDLQKALVSLEQSHQENNRIMRIVAHDLKSPISAINNMIYSLLKKDYPHDLKETFQLIKTACGSSMGLINDVLHQKKDPSALRKELVDMKILLEYCVDLLQTKADEKKQHLNLHAEHAILPLNRQKMWRVISNIVNNAIKFSPEYGRIDIRLEKKADTVLLSVHDSGIGIPPELKDKIFNMSPDASRPGTFGEESYGLGLSISLKIIEEHKGRIWFDSTDGKGAVFYIELPCLN